MHPRKFIIIIAALLGLVFIVLLIGVFAGKDEVRPRLNQILLNNNTLSELSESAQTKASEYPLQVAAANLYTTLQSDNAQLSNYYQQQYRSKPAAKNSDPVENLEKTQTGSQFDSSYRAMATELVEKNLALLNTVQAQTTNQTLKPLVTQVIANQQAALEQLR